MALQPFLQDSAIVSKVEAIHRKLHIPTEVRGAPSGWEGLLLRNTPASVSSDQADADSSPRGRANTDGALEMPTTRWRRSLTDGVLDGMDTELTPAKVSALLADLLHEFRSKDFQSKLKRLVDENLAGGGRDLSDVPGRRELAYSVQSEVMSRHGLSSDPAGIERMRSALEPLMGDPSITAMIEAIDLKLKMPRRQSHLLKSECQGPSGSDSESNIFRRNLTRSRAACLQKELLAGFADPDFQQQLAELRQEDRGHPYRQSFRELVRRVQAGVLPRYGFRVNDEGIKDMLEEVGAHLGHPEVFVLSVAIDEALYGAKPREAEQADRNSFTPSDVPALLRAQLVAFSAPDFQVQLRALKVETTSDDAVDNVRLIGRAELICHEQQKVLFRCGFESSMEALEALNKQCTRCRSDREVAKLLHAVSAKVGMELTTCARLVTEIRRRDATKRRSRTPPGSPRRNPEKAPEKATGPVQLLKPVRFPRRTAAAPKTIRAIAAPAASAVVEAVAPAAEEPALALEDIEEAKPAVEEVVVLAKVEPAASSSPSISKSRALVLLSELAGGLGRQVCRNKGAAGASEVLGEVLPSYGIGAGGQDEEAAIEELWRVLQPLMGDAALAAKVEGVKEQLNILGKEGPGRRARGRASKGFELPSLELEDKAVALHNELLQRYSSPYFQKKVNRIQRAHSSSSKEYGKILVRLIREEQNDVLPNYGYETSDDGVKQMYCDFGPVLSKPGVAQLAAVIDEALYGPELQGAAAARESKKLSKRRVLALMREHLAGFSTAEFQWELKGLKEASPLGEKDDHFQLEGRAELALGVQNKILPKYGFQQGHRGVHEMMASCSQHMLDAEVVCLTDAINAKLGMTPAACQRFRQRLACI